LRKRARARLRAQRATLCFGVFRLSHRKWWVQTECRCVRSGKVEVVGGLVEKEQPRLAEKSACARLRARWRCVGVKS